MRDDAAVSAAVLARLCLLSHGALQAAKRGSGASESTGATRRVSDQVRNQ